VGANAGTACRGPPWCCGRGSAESSWK
jgi:hypothetical protein